MPRPPRIEYKGAWYHVMCRGDRREDIFKGDEESREVKRMKKVCTYAWTDPSVHKHFPKAIPREATRMRFYFHPGYLQAGTVYQLRLQLPPSAIEELEKRFSQAKTSSLWGGEGKLSAVDGRPISAFYTNDEWESEEGVLFPPDYEIMILDPLLPDSQRSGAAQWNHGESHGVAISKQRNEIVYWAQGW